MDLILSLDRSYLVSFVVRSEAEVVGPQGARSPHLIVRQHEEAVLVVATLLAGAFRAVGREIHG